MAASRGVRFMFALLGMLILVHGQPNIYLTLGTATATSNNTHVLITAIGQDDTDGLPSLTCHTDLAGCCRGSDGVSAGEWYYPDGTKVPIIDGGDDFARIKNAPQVVRLYRRIPPAATSPTGLYCCVIPTTVGEQTICTDLVTPLSVTTAPPTTAPPTAIAPTTPPVVMCSTLSVLDNGIISYFPANSPTSVGTLVAYQCNVGYSLNGITTRTCGSNGVWSEEKPTCEAVDCGAPPSISNGSHGTPTKTSFEGIVSYTCNNGYFLEGLFEISCLANGQWDTTPTCVYFSLSSTNYITNNSEILISSVREGPGNYLTCHTDLPNCCRGSDTQVDGGVGAWHYPNGSVIPPAGGGDIYSNRDAAMVIRLNRRPGVASPTGLYCCVIPTSTGTDVSCVNLVAPISGSANTGAIVGGVVILGLGFILAVTAVIIAYLVLKQRRMVGVDLKRDTPDIPLSALDQSSPSQMYEDLDASYEEIDKPRPLKRNFDFSQCEAYVTTNPSPRREGVINVEGSGTTTEETSVGNTTHETV